MTRTTATADRKRHAVHVYQVHVYQKVLNQSTWIFNKKMLGDMISSSLQFYEWHLNWQQLMVWDVSEARHCETEAETLSPRTRWYYLSSALPVSTCCSSNITVHDVCSFRCVTFCALPLTCVQTAVLYVNICCSIINFSILNTTMNVDVT